MTVYSGEVNKFSSPPNMHRSSLCFCWVMRLTSKENDSTDNTHGVYPVCVWSQKSKEFFITWALGPCTWDSVIFSGQPCSALRALWAAHQWNEQSPLAIGHTSQVWQCPSLCRLRKETKAAWLEQHGHISKFGFQLGILRQYNGTKVSSYSRME